jgi:hypothetical protein
MLVSADSTQHVIMQDMFLVSVESFCRPWSCFLVFEVTVFVGGVLLSYLNYCKQAKAGQRG